MTLTTNTSQAGNVDPTSSRAADVLHNPTESEESCIIHDHPVPPEEIARYSPVRDPDAEQDIASYVEGEASESVKHVEKIKTEYVLGDPYEIWDVTTDQGRWWVITNLTNLYSQKHFPSLDYTLSFHVGLMMRLRSRPNSADSSDPQPFDEVFRRQAQAKDRYDRAIEAEDYQAVGMQLRECLISLIYAMRRRVEIEGEFDRPLDADFKGWSSVLMNQLCRGEQNKKLRQYLKATSEKTWELVNWLTHDREANQTASSILIHACDTLIGHYIQLLTRAETDNIKRCPLCSSRNIRTHFDINVEPDGQYYTTCGVCDWSSHPAWQNGPIA
ncbi:MAG TPA: hypothetical protein VJ779_18230 [Acetobacteraceae bacterium]|nr:hypothetical protein [Acetobacteraceae bacterium]